MAYESESLLWKRDQWRVPTALDKAQVHLIPASVVEALPRSLHRKKQNEQEDKRACLIGISFHIPSVALTLFIILADFAGAQQTPAPIYRSDEVYLRVATWNTVWWPGVVESFPGVLTVNKITWQMQQSFLAEVSTTLT